MIVEKVRPAFRLAFAFALVLVFGLLLPQAVASESCPEGAPCAAAFPLGPKLYLPVYASRPLGEAVPQIRRAVVVIHGVGRDARQYFHRVGEAARLEAVEEQTLIVAPRFTISADRTTADRASDQRNGAVFWDRNSNWRRGDWSSVLPEGQISSFRAVERLLAYLGDRALFPNLGKITVVGHSAGGQFVQRFAAGHAEIPEVAHTRLRYVAANPGAYLYLNPYRPVQTFDGRFAPPHADLCGDYNHYDHGLDQLNRFMMRASREKLVQHARQRPLTLLLGERDINPWDRTLNRTCSAALQGRHRLERGRLFKAHLDRFFAPHNTQVVLVPAVGHAGGSMFQSDAGRAVIFF
ncbi:hypothetical protein HBA54_24690 [Pelagibius litoralis]|uniref:Alpha/beta hydrolase family protein n=1 Tax=Pelagibius litoralis TaxID=374515 RepID=A0A967F2F9_9PROT|nr:hypothetical protein [Pelagibius litoralis]NIA71798.1 hypothetical protein [Pelagibius litoralis]